MKSNNDQQMGTKRAASSFLRWGRGENMRKMGGGSLCSCREGQFNVDQFDTNVCSYCCHDSPWCWTGIRQLYRWAFWLPARPSLLSSTMCTGTKQRQWPNWRSATFKTHTHHHSVTICKWINHTCHTTEISPVHRMPRKFPLTRIWK